MEYVQVQDPAKPGCVRVLAPPLQCLCVDVDEPEPEPPVVLAELPLPVALLPLVPLVPDELPDAPLREKAPRWVLPSLPLCTVRRFCTSFTPNTSSAISSMRYFC